MASDETNSPEESSEEGKPRRMSRRSMIGAGGAAAAGVAGAALAGSVASAATAPGTNKLPVPVKTVSEYIAVATVIATQIESNPKFAALMQANPQGELTKLGIGEDAVRELLTGEVGFAAAGTSYNCSFTCILTCLTTGSCCCTNCVPGLAFGAPVSGFEVSEGRAQLAQSLVSEGHLKLPGIPKNKGT
jgi:hypothetical protein